MSAITLIKNIINDSLAEGSVPGSLQVGKMTLIDKKKPSLDVTKNHSETLKQDMWKGRFLQPGPGWVQAQMFKCKLCTNDLVCAKDNHKEEHCICLAFCAMCALPSSDFSDFSVLKVSGFLKFELLGEMTDI